MAGLTPTVSMLLDGVWDTLLVIKPSLAGLVIGVSKSMLFKASLML